MSFKKRVLLIGIDGASSEIITPLIEDKKLSTFLKIRKQGTFCKFNSALPPNSATGWTSLLSGKNAGKHDIFDFYDKTNGTYHREIINSHTIKSRRIWDILSEQRLKSIIMNVPVTYPPTPINGIMVSGMLTPHGSNFTYPADLSDELQQKNYTIDIFDHFRDTLDSYLNLAVEVMTKRQQVFLDLLQNNDWDFGTIVFSTPERLQHTIWNHKAELQKIYIVLDQLLGELLDQVQDENTYVFFVSNYGFRSIMKKFFVNEWLSELGLLSKKISTEKSTIPEIIDDQFGHQQKQRLVANFLAKTGITKDNIRSVFPTQFCEFVKKVTPAYLRKLFPKENLIIDWEKTKAFFPSRFSQGIRINLKGREPQGIVKPGWEYEKLRDSIIRELYRLKDPHTFENIIEQVYKREEIYHGDYYVNAPDIIFEPKDFNYILEPNKRTSMYCISHAKDDYPVYANYDSKGFLIATGSNIHRDKIRDISLYDIVPTILNLLDVPVPDDLDGKVISGLFENEFDMNSDIIDLPSPSFLNTDYLEYSNDQPPV